MIKVIHLFIFLIYLSFNFKGQTPIEKKYLPVDSIQNKMPFKKLDSLDKAISKDKKNVMAYLKRAHLEFEYLFLYEALNDVNTAINLDSKLTTGYILRGKINTMRIDFKYDSMYVVILTDYEAAYKLEPNNPEVLYTLGSFYDGHWDKTENYLSNKKKSLDLLNKCSALNPNREYVYYTRADVKFNLKDTLGAIDDMSLAIKQSPKYIWNYIMRARYYRALNQFDKSLHDLNTAIKIDSISSVGDLFYERGITHLNLNNFDNAISDLTYIINTGNKEINESEYHNLLSYIMAPSYYYRGFAYYNKNNHEKACRDWVTSDSLGDRLAKKAIKEHCVTAQKSLFDIALSKYENEDYNGALENINTYLGANPNSEDAIITRGHCKYMLKDYIGAIDDYNVCLNFNPKNIDAIYYSGNSYFEIANYKAAIVCYNKNIAIDKKNVDAFYQRGLSKDKLNDYKGALVDYNQVIALDPKIYENEIYFKRAVIKSILGDNLGAVSDYTKALKFDPNNSATYINRGNCKSALKDIQGAIKDFTSAIEQEPTFAAAYYNRGLNEFKLGNKIEACSDIRTAMELGYEVTGTEIKEICK